jgi:hypothetical protein
MLIGQIKDGEQFRVVGKKDVYTKKTELVSNALTKSGVTLYFSPKTQVERVE